MVRALADALTRKLDGLARAISRLIEMRTDDRRMAGDDEAFRLAIDAAITIAQDQADGICAVGEVGWCQESRLPDVLLFEIAQRLGEAEGKIARPRFQSPDRS